MEVISFNLITLGLVVLILAIYRYLDKNNRSLEKVKKFSDKEQERLAGFIDSRTREIQNLAIDLSVNLKTGKEILKRIGDSEQGLSGKAAVLEAVEKKFNEYDTLIEELNGATVTCESNIKKIREESEFVDRLSKQIKAAQGKMSEIEASIPAMREELAKKNEETAKQEKHLILEEAGAKIHAMRESATAFEKKVGDYGECMTALDSRLSSFEDTASGRLESMLAEFEEQAVTRRDHLRLEFSREIEATIGTCSARKEELEKAVTEILAGSDTGLAEADARIERILEKKQKETLAFEVELSKKLAEAKAQAAQLEREVFEGCKVSAAKRAEELKRVFVEKMERLSAELDGRGASFVEEITRRQSDYEAGFEEFKKRMEESLAVTSQSGAERMLEIESQVFSVSQSLEARLTGYEKKCTEELEKAVSQFEEKANSASLDLASREQELENESAKIAFIEKESRSKIENLREELESSLSGISAKITGASDKLDTELKSRLDAANAALDEAVSEINAKITGASYTLDTELKSRLEAARASLDAAISDINVKISDSSERLDEDLETRLDAARASLDATVSGISLVIDESSSTLDSKYKDKLGSLKAGLEKDFSDIASRIEKSTTGLGSELKAGMEKLQAEFDKNFPGLRSKIEDASSVLDTELKSRLDAARTSLAGTVSGIQSKIEEAATRLHGELEAKLGFLESEMETGVSSLKIRMDEQSRGLYDSIAESSAELEIKVMKRIEKQLAGYEGDLDYRIKKLEDANLDVKRFDLNLRESVEEKKEEIKESLALVAKELSDKAFSAKLEHTRILKELGESIKLLDCEVNELKGKAASEVSEKLKVFEDSFYSEIRERKEKIEESLAAFESEIQASCGEKMKNFDVLASGYEKSAAGRQEEQAKILSDLEEGMNDIRLRMDALYDSVASELRERLADLEVSTKRDIETRGKKLDRAFLDWEESAKATLDSRVDSFEELAMELKDLADEKKEEQEKILAELGEGMAEVEKKLEAIKDRSYKELSAKIEKFGNGISEDLDSRSGKIEKRIALWQVTVNTGIDEKIREFGKSIEEKYSGYETEWIKLVNTKLGGVSEKFTAVQRQFDAYYERLAKETDIIEKKQARLASQNHMFEKAGHFMARLEKDLAVLRSEMDSIDPMRKKLAGLDEEYTKIRAQSEEISKRVEEALVATNTKLKGIRSEIEKEKAGISSFVSTIDETIEGYKDSFNTKIDAHFRSTDSKVDELRNVAEGSIARLKREFETERDALVSQTASEREEIKRQVSEMSQKTGMLSVETEESINCALQKFKEEMSGIESGYMARAKSFEGSIDSRMSVFSKSMKDDHEKIKTLSERWFGRIETDYKTLLANFAELQKQQQSFESQTRLFERADKLKLELRAEIEELKKDLAVIEPELKKMSAVDTELAKTQKATADVSGKIARFFAEKTRIDELDKNTKQLVKLSESVEKRLESVTANHDVLQEIELKLRSLFDLEQKTETQLERLEKKNRMIETTTKEVENNYRLLDDLEKYVKRIDESVQALPPRIGDIQEQVKFLAENKQKADAAIEQVNKVSEIMADIECRMTKLQVAREWLSKTETRLENIGKHAGEQLAILKAIMKEDGGSDGKKGKGAPSYDTRQMIVKLARQGWAVKEIAKASNVSQGEVELILELEPQKR